MKNDSLFNEMLDRRPALRPSLDNNAYRASLAHELLTMRKRAGLTQTQLARRLGWKQPQVSTIEKATGPVPEPGRVAAYAAACGVGAQNAWTFTYDDTETRRVAM